jgi:hypothetical protein
VNGRSQSINRTKSRDSARSRELRKLPRRQTNVAKKFSIQRERLEQTFLYVELGSKDA